MASSHAKRVAANGRLVREIVDQLVADDVRPRQRKCLRSLEVVEDWLEGRVDPDTLRDVADLMRSESVRLLGRGPRRPGWRGKESWSHACDAVASLATMAAKGKGWQDEHDLILQSCVFAVAVNDPSGGQAARAAIHRRLRDRREAALARGRRRAADERRPEGGESEPRTVVPTDAPRGLSRLGRVVAARLDRLGALVDPRFAEDADALRSFIGRVPKAVREFDARYGGLVIPDGDDSSWVLGALVNLSLGSEALSEPRRLVPVMTNRDAVAYLDSRGIAWVQDTVEDPEPFPFAPSGAALIARATLIDMERAHARHDRSIRVEGRRGASIARSLGLSAIEVASDASWRAWADADHVVIQDAPRDDGGTWTTVAGPEARRFAS